MEPIQIITAVVFLITIGLVITRWIDSVVAAMLGVVSMIVAGSMTEVQAFQFVDWNVIAILISIWLIAGYFGRTGIPQHLADKILKLSKRNIPLFITLIGTLSGFVSTLVDNVVVVLMFAPIIFHIRKLYHFEGTGPIIFIGLCANLMGTALLLGDLPPQMLHSVSGIEFHSFIWQFGRPSSFIILTITYLFVIMFFYFKFRRAYSGRSTLDIKTAHVEAQEPIVHIQNKPFALVVCGVFTMTIIGMSLRELLGVKLGFIAFSSALLLVLIFEIFKSRFPMEPPDLEEILAEIDWKAVGFYVALFALVGGLEHARILKIIANWLIPYIQANILLGVSILYWVTALIVGIVEHDAYILTLLYVIRDLEMTYGINPWPFYWGLLWAGTLGSNLTIAGAPALYVALTMGEKEDGKKLSLWKFLAYSVPYVLITLLICYILMIFIWVLPFMQ